MKRPSKKLMFSFFHSLDQLVVEKTSLSAELSAMATEKQIAQEQIAKLQNEMSKMSESFKNVELRGRSASTRLERQILALQAENRNLQAEIVQAKHFSEDLHLLKERDEEEKQILLENVESVRADYISLKEKYENLRANPFTNSQQQQRLRQEMEDEIRRQRLQSARQKLRSAGINCDMQDDVKESLNAEMAQLRKELQRYKLELKNRDASFNRMFAAAQHPNGRSGALIADESDDDVATIGSKGGQTSAASHNRKGSNYSSQRVPLIPAKFSNRASSTSVNNTTSSRQSNATSLPPVEINYR